MAARILPLVLAAILLPAPAFAWGAAGHRYIMRRAIDALPAPLQAFFNRHRDELVLRVMDPDLWRIAGWDDGPNHFLNLDAPEFGPDPFAKLPRDRAAAVKQFGEDGLARYGRLPWRVEEMSGRLRDAFTRARRGPSAAGDVVLFAAVVSHYVQDAHQPFHATRNHDGQLTGQDGIHARFETVLFERVVSQLTIQPPRPAPIRSSRDALFDVLLDSQRLVAPVLAADRAAAGSRTVYEDAYYDALFPRVRPILERRIGEAISATAGVIMGAWELAGRPALP
jgi:hypothetical protein